MKTQIQLVLVAAAALLIPGLAHGVGTVNWNVATGDLGTSTNWNPNTAITTTGLTWSISNGGAATVSNGASYTLNSALNVGDTNGSGTLSLSGNGALTVTPGNLSIGNAVSGGSGAVILNDTSKLTIGGSLYIGHRTAGTLTVNAGSQVIGNGALVLGDGSATANGTLNLSGTMKLTAGTGNINLGKTGFTTEKATLNIYSGSYLSTLGGLTTTAGTGTFLINLDGSGSTFSFAKAIAAGNAATTFAFTADAGGVTTVTTGTSVDITGATLKLNIDAYTGTHDLVLFSGSSIAGNFSSIQWLGADQGTVVYGADSIYIAGVPEPSTVVFSAIGLFAIAAATSATRRRQRTASIH